MQDKCDLLPGNIDAAVTVNTLLRGGLIQSRSPRVDGKVVDDLSIEVVLLVDGAPKGWFLKRLKTAYGVGTNPAPGAEDTQTYAFQAAGIGLTAGPHRFQMLARIPLTTSGLPASVTLGPWITATGVPASSYPAADGEAEYVGIGLEVLPAPAWTAIGPQVGLLATQDMFLALQGYAQLNSVVADAQTGILPKIVSFKFRVHDSVRNVDIDSYTSSGAVPATPAAVLSYLDAFSLFDHLPHNTSGDPSTTPVLTALSSGNYSIQLFAQVDTGKGYVGRAKTGGVGLPPGSAVDGSGRQLFPTNEAYLGTEKEASASNTAATQPLAQVLQGNGTWTLLLEANLRNSGPGPEAWSWTLDGFVGLKGKGDAPANRWGEVVFEVVSRDSEGCAINGPVVPPAVGCPATDVAIHFFKIPDGDDGFSFFGDAGAWGLATYGDYTYVRMWIRPVDPGSFIVKSAFMSVKVIPFGQGCRYDVAKLGVAADLAANGQLSDGNGVLEPGEEVILTSSWQNTTAGTLTFSSAGSVINAPVGATHLLTHSTASYMIPPGAVGSCGISITNCFTLSVTNPSPRPSTATPHWDVVLRETPQSGGLVFRDLSLHVGNSFPDVPKTNPYYPFVERILHFGVTTGTTPTTFVPDGTVPRINMAIFLARAVSGDLDSNLPIAGTAQGRAFNCVVNGTSVFSDVAPSDPFCKHVHYIYAQGVTTGCSPPGTAEPQFCPTEPVTRGQMAIFTARAMTGNDASVPTTYTDPTTQRYYSCNPVAPTLHYADIAANAQVCRYAHYLWARDVFTGDPQTGDYVESAAISRGLMAQFLANGFNLKLEYSK